VLSAFHRARVTCLFTSDDQGTLSPNNAAAAADSKSQQDSATRRSLDVESAASEMPCGGAQETLVRQKAAGGAKTTVEVAVLKREEKSLQTTIMLITVSTSYVLAYLPVLFHFLIYFIKLKVDRKFDISDMSMLIAGNYTKLLYVGGVAVNFFLYTVSGRVFRKQLIQLLACRRSTHSAISGARRRAAAADF